MRARQRQCDQPTTRDGRTLQLLVHLPSAGDAESSNELFEVNLAVLVPVEDAVRSGEQSLVSKGMRAHLKT